MAQRTVKKSEELTQKMGAVISEFQNKAGIDETMVFNENTTLEKHAKESTSLSEEGKNMYVAIVEAHVYTNKEFLIDQLTEISETASVQSVEETNIALDSSEVIIEEVAVENMKTHETKQVEEVFENAEEVNIQNTTTQEVSSAVEETREVAVKEVVEPLLEVKEINVMKSEYSTGESAIEEKHIAVASVVDTSIKEESSIAFKEESKVEFIEARSSITKDESLTIASATALSIQEENTTEIAEFKKEEIKLESSTEKKEIVEIAAISETVVKDESSALFEEEKIESIKVDTAVVKNESMAIASITEKSVQEENITSIAELKTEVFKLKSSIEKNESVAIAALSETVIKEESSSTFEENKVEFCKIGTEIIKDESLAIASITERSVQEENVTNIAEYKTEEQKLESSIEKNESIAIAAISESVIKEEFGTVLEENKIELSKLETSVIKDESIAVASITEVSIQEENITNLAEFKTKEINLESSVENNTMTVAAVSEVTVQEQKPISLTHDKIEHRSIESSAIDNGSVSIAATIQLVEESHITKDLLETAKIEERKTQSSLVQQSVAVASITETSLEHASLSEMKIINKEEKNAVINQIEELKSADKTVVIIEEPEISKEDSLTVKVIDRSSKEASAELKIIKERIIEVEQALNLTEEEDIYLKRDLEMNEYDKKFYMESLSSRSNRLQTNLTIRTDLAHYEREDSILSDENNNIDTPTPSTIPPTPLTDEYVFKLRAPMPRCVTPIPRDPSPEIDHEDPHIVKKKLIPHIETTIESVVYDTPLSSPPPKASSPVYTKPGLKGGADRNYYKEEILEIGRRSSLLASAIDKTIKSIEEYKEEVGIDRKETSEETTIYNGYSKVVETKSYSPEDKITMEDLQNIENDNEIETVTLKLNNDTNASKDITEEVTINLNNDIKTEVNLAEDANKIEIKSEEKFDPLLVVKSVKFDPDNIAKDIERPVEVSVVLQAPKPMYMNDSGELIGTIQGIVDGLEDAVIDEEVAKDLGKPGMSEDKIAELISGESEMLREAHVMGLSRVLSSHMHRADDDSSVDFKKIKPIIESLKDSEVLKALNDDLTKTKEEIKKEERKWTTFLQKPKRAVPSAKFGYPGWTNKDEDVEEPYKVKIVKQPKPKVAPDYKPEDFDTGPLPWEERALNEPPPPDVEAEEPILIPEEVPEFLEAVDPLPESEVPDLETTGIPLPPPPEPPTEEVIEVDDNKEETELEETVEPELEPEDDKPVEEVQAIEEMDNNRLAEQLLKNVQNMVDPSASIDQQLSQMRAQIAALSQLPEVIQQSLEMVNRQLSQLCQKETQVQSLEVQVHQESQVSHVEEMSIQESTVEINEVTQNHDTIQEEQENVENGVIFEEVIEEPAERRPSLTAEELERLKKEEAEMIEEQQRIEKQKKELIEQMKQEQESRQLKQRPTPRVGKPKPVFGPITPQERPLVLPGGRRWRKPQDAYNEQFIKETLSAQAEIIQGKAMGINFMKYEKPPVSLDHLQNSDVYKMVHNMDSAPTKRVELLTPIIAEADYREKCRSITPCTARMEQEEHLDIPQQLQP